MSLTITVEHLRAIAGPKVPNAVLLADSFNNSAPMFSLNVLTQGRPLRAEHFLSQIAHESGGFKYTRELWGPTKAQRTYQGRMGNNNPGDGKRYMGHSLMQITGKDNHREFTAWAKRHYPDAPDFVVNPEMLELYPWALIGAFWYWDTRGLNALADRDNLLAITKRINGGTNGLADRRLRYALASKALETGIAVPLAPVPANDNRGRKTLRRRASGPDVEALQRALGLPQADGRFGPITEAAVIGFQRSHGLLPDGIAGPGFWRAIDDLRRDAA